MPGKYKLDDSAVLALLLTFDALDEVTGRIVSRNCDEELRCLL